METIDGTFSMPALKSVDIREEDDGDDEEEDIDADDVWASSVCRCSRVVSSTAQEFVDADDADPVVAVVFERTNTTTSFPKRDPSSGVEGISLVEG